MRILTLFLAALFVAGGTGYYWWQGAQRGAPIVAQAAIEAPKLREVYVPAVELSAGSILKPEHLGRMPVEDSSVIPEMIVAEPAGEALLVGSVARQVLPKGVPIARSAVVQPGDRGFLAAVLPQGKRAISIPISEVAGISGLVLPGDRVDIILTYSLEGDAIDATRDVRASETVMSNIRVLALDQRLHQTQAAVDGQPLAEAPPIARTATLQVSPREAEMITLATSLGDLSMVLNSVHDGGDAVAEASEIADAEFTRVTGELAQPRRMTLDSDVTSLLQRQSDDGPASPSLAPLTDQLTSIQIVRGTTVGAIELGERVAAAGPAIDPALEAPQD